MKSSDMVVVDLNGNVVEGDYRPSSDTSTHLHLYRNFWGIGGITHTHSMYATMFAQARLEIPCLGTTHADHFRGPVPVTEPLTADQVEADYEGQTGQFIVDRFAVLHPMEMPAVFGSHMLEICPSIAAPASKPSCEVHPLGIGGKEDPVRLVFNARTGPAINASVVDLGDRFRLLINTVESIAMPEALPKLPVARVLWQPQPDLATAAAAWIYAGGAHHTGYATELTAEHLEDFATMAGVELTVIDQATELRVMRQHLLSIK